MAGDDGAVRRGTQHDHPDVRPAAHCGNWRNMPKFTAMKRAPTVYFPAWQHGTSICWLTPIGANNSHLQSGLFKQLALESLRPARDPQQRPITGMTHDGKLRGLLNINGRFRHIDVTARYGMGARVAVPIFSAGAGDYRMQPAQALQVEGVRALRMRSMLTEDNGAPWCAPGTPPELAVTAWDGLLKDLFFQVPARYRAKNNPWLWCHSVRFAT